MKKNIRKKISDAIGKDKQDKDVEEVKNDSDEEEVVKKTIEEIANDNLVGWKRALADYENLARETREQKAAFAKYANQGLIEDLLPTLEYFDAAMASQPEFDGLTDEQRKVVDNWLVGMGHIQKLMLEVLENAGLSKVSVNGVLNTDIHEAVEEVESDEPEGTILKVVSNGYMLGDKLIRPAKVIVAASKNK